MGGWTTRYYEILLLWMNDGLHLLQYYAMATRIRNSLASFFGVRAVVENLYNTNNIIYSTNSK